jgi:hypothetical protein
MERISKNIFEDLKEMPSECDFFDLEWKLTPEECKKVKNGFASGDMDEKWNIYFDDHKVYFHRSWTGSCIYIADLKELSDSSAIITKVKVNRDKKEYNYSNNDEDKELFKKIVQFQLIDYEPRVKKINILDGEFDSIRSLIPNEYLESKFNFYKESLENLRLTWNGYPTSEYIDMNKTRGIESAIEKLNSTNLETANIISTTFGSKMIFLISDQSFKEDLGVIEFIENPPMKQ